MCVIRDCVRLVQPRRPPANWLGRRVGLPLWLGWGVDWVKNPGTRPQRPYSAAERKSEPVYTHDMVALITEGVHVVPVRGKMVNPAASKPGASKWLSFDLDAPDWAARGVTLLQLTFASAEEARSRACLLMARTWHAYSRSGAQIMSYEQVRAAW